MKTCFSILCSLFAVIFLSQNAHAQAKSTPITFDFFGTPAEFRLDNSCVLPYAATPGEITIQSFQAELLNRPETRTFIASLLSFKEKYELDDWLYYQLIRRTAQQISPKAENYYRYTLYKWILLIQSGYDATLKTNGEKLLFYVQSDENIYNIPYYTKDGKQYVCLNYHDYGFNVDFEKEHLVEIVSPGTGEQKGFSYKINRLPFFNPADYQEKDLHFTYYDNTYNFKIKLNPQIRTIFANYPVVDYESYFNIPLSTETYSSLIPLLRKNIKGMNTKNGIDYLLHFTRYAFLFKPDSEIYGDEKRLSPEQTLLTEGSDCEDRAALFFFLVKEIYNLPMIVISYPDHVTIAVKLDKPVGKPVLYNGVAYSVCEPTPQNRDLPIGKSIPRLSKEAFEIVYAYTPDRK